MKKLWSFILEMLGLLSTSKAVRPFPSGHAVERFEALRTYINTADKRVVFFDGG